MEFERIADKKRLDFIVTAVKTAVPLSGTILDIGCGNGIISRGLGAFGYTVTGVDSSAKTIETARRHNTLPNVNFKVVAADELSSDPHLYDAVICSEVLEHLTAPGSLLSVIFSHLKDKGALIVTVPNGQGPRELLVTRPVQYLQQKNNLLWKIIQLIKKGMGYTGTTVQSSADDLLHKQFFSKKSLEQLAEDNGFRITAFRSGNFLEQVFPFSLIAKRSAFIQKMDCALADRLPYSFSSGFMSVWKKQQTQ